MLAIVHRKSHRLRVVRYAKYVLCPRFSAGLPSNGSVTRLFAKALADQSVGQCFVSVFWRTDFGYGLPWRGAVAHDRLRV